MPGAAKVNLPGIPLSNEVSGRSQKTNRGARSGLHTRFMQNEQFRVWLQVRAVGLDRDRSGVALARVAFRSLAQRRCQIQG